MYPTKLSFNMTQIGGGLVALIDVEIYIGGWDEIYHISLVLNSHECECERSWEK